MVFAKHVASVIAAATVAAGLTGCAALEGDLDASSLEAEFGATSDELLSEELLSAAANTSCGTYVVFDRMVTQVGPCPQGGEDANHYKVYGTTYSCRTHEKIFEAPKK